nr:MAG TPA: hypothetical protein [Bacteriophage sp.]
MISAVLCRCAPGRYREAAWSNTKQKYQHGAN